MHLIPVIDLMKGRVVHAKKGERASYLPLQSKLVKGSEPDEVVTNLLEVFPFRTLYIADIDAIQGQGNNNNIIRELHSIFPSLELWVDTGLRDKSDMGSLPWSGSLKPVIGSETLADSKALQSMTQSVDGILSLDFRGDAFLGSTELLDAPEYWTKEVIIMSLSRVGSDQGPDMERLAHFKQHTTGRNIYAAGGIRELADIAALERAGIAGALLASALHNGKLPPAVIKQYL